MAKQIKVREDNYFAVQGWMVTELKLKGNALMLYAIIYGFSQTSTSDSLCILKEPIHLLLSTTITQLKVIQHRVILLCKALISVLDGSHISNRLNEHDEILKSNSEMIGAIKELATEVKYMRGDLNETVERLNKLEGKDGDKWGKFKWLIVTGLVTLILGYLAVSVGLK